jgi:enoyl-CoA hydratase/carnithine racemase
MELKYHTIEIEERVAVITINRPEKGNALSPDVLMEMESLFTSLNSNPGVNVAVLTGGEKLFSAGFDLDVVRQMEKESNEAFIALFHRAYRSILFCSRPVIAAVGGPAIAGGFDLTMMCDIRYASENARFGQREMALSLPPIMDPLWRIIGLGRAKEVAFTGRIYDAAEAERMGYVSRVFPRGELLRSVLPIARTMAGYGRQCLTETKQLTHLLVDKDLDGAMTTQEWLFRSYLGAPDNRQRVADLLASLKKKPA